MSGEPTLSNGDSGEWVLHLQRLMTNSGSWQGAVDSTFGDELEEAVKALQESNYLTCDGIVGDLTWAMVDRLQPAHQATPELQASKGYEGQAGQQVSASNGNPMLRKGDSGEWVTYLQQLLQDAEHWAGAVDGAFGHETEQAVRRLQHSNGLAQDGIVGAHSWDLLDRLQHQQQAPTAQGSHQAGAAVTGSGPGDYPTLRRGASGEWVTYLQQVMQSIGHWPGAVDGEFGDGLEQAVKTVQHGNALMQNGVVDDALWQVLNRLLQSSSGSGSGQGHGGGSAHGQGSGSAQPHPAGSTPVDPGLAVTVGGHQYVIFTDEVRQGGSASWRARNPGNIRNGDSYGAYRGKKINAGSSGQFAVFPDEATGFQAIKSVLHQYGHATVATAMSHYAPKGDGANDPDAYAEHVAKRMGVSVTTYVDKLNDEQLASFAAAIREFEGWVPGHTFKLDDPALPDEVKRAINGK